MATGEGLKVCNCHRKQLPATGWWRWRWRWLEVEVEVVEVEVEVGVRHHKVGARCSKSIHFEAKCSFTVVKAYILKPKSPSGRGL